MKNIWAALVAIDMMGSVDLLDGVLCNEGGMRLLRLHVALVHLASSFSNRIALTSMVGSAKKGTALLCCLLRILGHVIRLGIALAIALDVAKCMWITMIAVTCCKREEQQQLCSEGRPHRDGWSSQLRTWSV